MPRMTLDQLEAIYHQPLFDLLSRAREAHEVHWPRREVQLCTLLSIKTGGCSEDCSYCAQSAHHATPVEPEPLLSKDSVMRVARAAKDNGSTRFCMGAAWRGVRETDKKFEQVLEIVRDVSSLGMEVCVTLGELTPAAAQRLRDAGVTAYNHNIDTSPEFYPNIVTTHTFEDRLRTIRAVQDVGMSVCCGGIIGMGEALADRLRMLEVVTGFDPAPESLPINSLVPIPGTPLADLTRVDVFEVVRLIATARIALPKTKIRLSAGREGMSREAQALCFFAGANSIFFGDKLLTTGNVEAEQDLALLRELGLEPQAPFTDVEDPLPHGCHKEEAHAH